MPEPPFVFQGPLSANGKTTQVIRVGESMRSPRQEVTFRESGSAHPLVFWVLVTSLSRAGSKALKPPLCFSHTTLTPLSLVLPWINPPQSTQIWWSICFLLRIWLTSLAYLTLSPFRPLCACVLAKPLQLRPTLWDAVDRSPPWDSPGKNARVGCCALLQGVSPAQGSGPCVLRLRRWQGDSSPLTPPFLHPDSPQ